RVLSDGGGQWTTIWTLPDEKRPVADALRLAQLLSGTAIDGSLSSSRIGLEARLDAWRQLRSRYPACSSTSFGQPLAWERRMADAFELTEQWPAAMVHLNRLVAAQPGDLGLRARRAAFHARLRHWSAAAADLQAALRLAPSRTEA